MVTFKTLNILLILILFQSGLNASEIRYKVSDIPGELKKNAKAVVRKNDIIIEVRNLSEATQTVS